MRGVAVWRSQRRVWRYIVLDNERPASERRIIIINNVLSLVVTSLP